MTFLDKGGHYTDAAWKCAKVWDDERKPIKWIARQLGVEPSTVRTNLAKLAPSLRPLSHAAPCITPEHKVLIERRRSRVKDLSQCMIPGPHGPRREFPSALMISNVWNRENPGEEIGSATVRRDLRMGGLVSLKRQRGPKRKLGDEARRLSAARGYKKMGAKMLKRIGFSDAKYFDSNSHGGEREWCLPGQQPSKRVQDTWAPRVHVWGFIAFNMKLLVRLPSHKPTAQSYKQYCLIPLLKYLSTQPEGDLVIFQYDGDTAYGANDVLAYLKRKGVKLLKGWPARSCDLSPIENMWSNVQRRVDRYGPSDVEEVWKFVKKAWDDIPLSEVNNLVNSFPTRLTKCIKAGGATISTKTKKVERPPNDPKK